MNKGQNKVIEKVLSRVVTEETAEELANLEGKALEETFNSLYEQMDYQKLLPKEPTVKSVVQELYELSTARLDNIDRDTMQDLFYQQVDQLASLLGSELED